MKLALALMMLGAVACASASPAPVVGSPLSVPQLKFAVMAAVGKPVYCDPDFYPIARIGGEQANAVSMYPPNQADPATEAGVLAHEHLSSGALTDAHNLTLYLARELPRRLA